MAEGGDRLLSEARRDYHSTAAGLPSTPSVAARKTVCSQQGDGEYKMATAKRVEGAKPAGILDAKAQPPVKKTASQKPRTANTAFMKAMTPSPALAAVIGDQVLPRTEVTKKIWEYIKQHGLQDPAKRTMINADAKLRSIFQKDQVSMFEMTKLISNHLK
jgi:chromatin remodeling complex protein RSC6